MGLKTKESLIDSTAAAQELTEVLKPQQEDRFSVNLTSEELFRIDTAILASLRNVSDFSQNLLAQLENGKFEMIAAPIKDLDFEMKSIQQDVMTDIAFPLQKMFDDMEKIVVEALQGV